MTDVVGQIRLFSFIGRGAYGTVFLCSNIKTKKEYILKEIPMETVNEDERALALNEVQILKVCYFIRKPI